MVTLAQLWLPIVVSGVAVFIASAMAWMIFPHHKGDMKKLANEDEVMGMVRQMNIPPGLYFFPHMSDCKAMKTDPAVKARFENGPHAQLHIYSPNFLKSMGRNMILSLLFCVFVSACVAYLATMAIPSGKTLVRPDFMYIFRFTGAAAIMIYTLGPIPQSIWFGTPLRNVMSCLVDGIAFGLITGAIFGWLWPSM